MPRPRIIMSIANRLEQPAPSRGGVAPPHFRTAGDRLPPLLALVLLCCAPAALLGQVVPGRYVLELNGDPAAVTFARSGSHFAAREAGFAARRAAIRQTQSGARAAVASHGGTVLESLDTVVNGLIISIPDQRAAELLQIPGAVRIHPVHRMRVSLNHALPLHKVPDAWALLPQGQAGAGAGIKIAMVDTGIDVNNPAFAIALPALSGFPKYLLASDQQFTNSKIIVAKNYTYLLPDGGDPDANDYMGHGTGTATAAAGGPAVTPYGPITGVAPQAYIGNYKVADGNGSTSDVIAKAVDDAVADGMDVLNISLGAYVTSYSDVSTSELAIAAVEAATAAGVVVTVSAGNDGPGATTIEDLASAPDVIAAGAISNDRSLGSAVTVSGVSPYEALPGNGPSPSQAIAGPLVDVAGIDPSGLACSPLPSGSVSGMVVLVERGSCTFETKIDNVQAGGALAVIVYNNDTTQPTQLISMSVGGATLPAVFIGQTSGADLKSRVAAASGLAITVDFSAVTPFPARTDLTDFSSRGPSLGSTMKPDLVAVGAELVTATESTFPSGELYDPSGFIDIAGTSYSAPLTAGAAAILKAARPGLTVAQYRSLLINNASPATAGPGVAATVQQAGAGVLNVAAALAGTVAASPTALNFGTGADSIRQTLNLTLTNLGTATDTYSLSVLPTGSSPAPSLSAASLSIDPGNSQQLSLTVATSTLASGEYQGFVQVAGSANPAPILIPYWYAIPGATPSGISVLYTDAFDQARSTAFGAIVFRVVDQAGLPFTGSAAPAIVVSSGGGTVRSVYHPGDVPGTYAVDLRTGTSDMQVDITIGALTQSIVIPIL